jgi:hypothetical protein
LGFDDASLNDVHRYIVACCRLNAHGIDDYALGVLVSHIVYDEEGDTRRARLTRGSSDRFRNPDCHADNVARFFVSIHCEYTSGLRTFHQLRLNLLLDRDQPVVLARNAPRFWRSDCFLSTSSLRLAKALGGGFFVSVLLYRWPNNFGWWRTKRIVCCVR